MKKSATAFEKLDAQNFKIVNNTENIAGGEFHHPHKTFRNVLVKTGGHHHFGFDRE